MGSQMGTSFLSGKNYYYHNGKVWYTDTVMYELDKGNSMGIKDRNKFRVVEGYKGSLKKMSEAYKEKISKRELKKNVLLAAAVLIIGIALFLFVNLRTYTAVSVTDTYSIAGAADSSYKEFADGILKYSKDGISYLDMDGEEQWNLPYQIKTPFVETNDVSAAVACKGGNDILIFQKEGKIGEIKTTLPIEKLSVSEQGIVCAILKNDSAPKIICYDTVGNVLVEHNTSLSGTGYPMDVAISADGEVLQVTYLYTYEGKLLSKVVYYNFGKSGESSKDYQVAHKEYENTVVASGFYMDHQTSVAVGDNCMTIFKGSEQVKEVATILFEKEVQLIGHSKKYIAVVFANSGESGCELRVYNKNGKLVTNEMFMGDYRNLKISGNQIILYDGKASTIFMKNGVQKFDGEMHNSIMEIVPVSGVNKYAVMDANGMEYVRLTN